MNPSLQVTGQLPPAGTLTHALRSNPARFDKWLAPGVAVQGTTGKHTGSTGPDGLVAGSMFAAGQEKTVFLPVSENPAAKVREFARMLEN